MPSEDFMRKAKETIKAKVPSHIRITSIEFEGPKIVIYTMDMDEFATSTEIVKQLAQLLRRRIAIRPTPSILMDTKNAEIMIRQMIPKDAEITNIWFDEDTGEVTIEAKSPGLAIGKHGAIFNELKRKIGWAPKVVRTPPLPSKTVGEIRRYLRMVSEERKDWLKKIARKINRDTIGTDGWVRVTSLGGYREVGRSATLIMTRESKILVDCGVKFGTEEDEIPYLNVPEFLPIESVDAVVITHAHLDHCGLLPVLYKYGFDGVVYCTPPTRDLMSLLQLDYMKVAYGEGRKIPFESAHVRKVIRNIITLNYGDTTDIAPDIRLTFQNAGHILGSSIAHFHIGDGIYNVAVTGDIKNEKTWLFSSATDKFPRLEALIIEATYGGYQDYQPSRREAADELKYIIKETIERKGKVLIPVFAVGRSQEVMIVIEQLMRHGELTHAQVYLDGMIWEATAIHTTYPEYLNSSLRSLIFQKGENPFLSEIFKPVESSSMRATICDSPEPCIILATSGMLNGGPVMEYFKELCTDEKNTIVFVGFQAEGTLGRRIQRGLKEFQMSNMNGRTKVLEINMNVKTVDGFSGHSDRRQLIQYVQKLNPKPDKIIINHGEESKCLELGATLYKKFGIETRVPYNLETIRLR